MCEQIASIPALVEETIIRLSEDVGRVTESRPDTKMISEIRTVVNRALVKSFWSANLYSSVQDAVHECIPEPMSVDTVVGRLVVDASVTVRVAKFLKLEVKRSSLGRPIRRKGS